MTLMYRPRYIQCMNKPAARPARLTAAALRPGHILTAGTVRTVTAYTGETRPEIAVTFTNGTRAVYPATRRLACAA